MKKILTGVFVAAALLVGVVLMRTLLTPAPGLPAFVEVNVDGADSRRAADRLAAAIRFRTISHGSDGPGAEEAEAFAGLAAFLTGEYPGAHAAMTRQTVGHSLVYRWAGSDNALPPVAFLAHLDVVPVEPGTEDQWTHPPFAGVVDQGAVWGRGALDDKGHVIALFEAAERLAGAGFAPERDVYFLFGHDEEVGGVEGAGAIAAMFEEKGVRFDFTIDEGSGLVEGVIPGAENPVALISTAEKGYLTVRLTASGMGGHSSAPARDTAVTRLARAVTAVNDDPFPAEIDRNVTRFLKEIAPEAAFSQRIALTNLWLFGGVVKASLTRDPTVAASLRTTTAPTVFLGGVKANVLPQSAEAKINYRIHPRDSVDSVLSRLRRQVGEDIGIEALDALAPSPVSSADSRAFKAIEASIAQTFGAVAAAPSLTLQSTDTKHFTRIADNNYRFTPFIYRTEDLSRIHGTDERISIENLMRGVKFYEDFIPRAASRAAPKTD